MNPSCTTERVLAVIPHLHATEPGLIDSIVSGSDPALPPPLSEVSADLTAVLWDLQIENTPLGELVPAAEAWRDEDLPVLLVPRCRVMARSCSVTPLARAPRRRGAARRPRRR